jgi:hypothetical protein
MLEKCSGCGRSKSGLLSYTKPGGRICICIILLHASTGILTANTISLMIAVVATSMAMTPGINVE